LCYVLLSVSDKNIYGNNAQKGARNEACNLSAAYSGFVSCPDNYPVAFVVQSDCRNGQQAIKRFFSTGYKQRFFGLDSFNSSRKNTAAEYHKNCPM
jgi:hypothetical protein